MSVGWGPSPGAMGCTRTNVKDAVYKARRPLFLVHSVSPAPIPILLQPPRVYLFLPFP